MKDLVIGGTETHKEFEERIARERARLASIFLGPKAENGDMFLKLLTDVVTDYVHWRRNFHPEDPAVIREWNKRDPAFADHWGNFIHKLDGLLGRLKRNDIPFASPRYVGHMLSDQLLPAIVGYVAGMLYNPNNVTAEAAPETAKLEAEFGERLAELVGYNPARSWGHICSGGTVANLEALWIARNIKYLPLAACIVRKTHNLSIKVPQEDRAVPIEMVSLWRLLNCSVGETLQIVESLASTLIEKGRDNEVGARQVALQMLIEESVGKWGVCGFLDRVRELFPEKVAELKNGLKPGVVIAPAIAHYSLTKVADILGLGRSAGLVKIGITPRFRMDVGELRKELDRCEAENIPVIAVVSFCGSTEEGAIDPVDEIADLRRRRPHLDFYHHCDGAYGAYVRTLLPDEAPTKMYSRISHGSPRLADQRPWLVDELARLDKDRQPWPADELRGAIREMRETDSVTIDPHKLGYVPYPAGAIVYRAGWVRDVIALRPGYLDDPFIGGYVVEGSKPGAAAAACWLASEVLPLRSDGHGILIQRSIRNAYTLSDALRELTERLEEGIKLCVLNYPPDLNIVCFVFNFSRGEADPLCLMNAYIEEVYHLFLKFDRKKALSAHEVIVSKTELTPDEYSIRAVEPFLRAVKVEPRNFCRKDSPEWNDRQSDDRIVVMRCVVMNPWLGFYPAEGRAAGPTVAHIQDLPFVWNFIDKLREYIGVVKANERAVEQVVLLERAGQRPKAKGARLAGALVTGGNSVGRT